RVLDLARADLVSAGLDDVGSLAPPDLHVAVAVADGHVARAEPAVTARVVGGEGLGGRVGPVEVLGEQIGSAHLDLADGLAVPRLDRRTRLVDDPQFHPTQWQADRARFALTVGAP